MVLAVVVPVAVLAVVASIDLLSAGVMLLTLPLVPVFMWLIGRYTEERTRERWLALRLLSNHFLDVVRGLPTLRAFNRSRQQASTLAQVGEHYRRTTIGTLRVGFLSGSVLELAATLGVALIAVTIGVRLVDGGLGLQAGLTVLVLAPELYLPVRQLAVQFHASADGVAVADRMLELLDGSPEAKPTRMLLAPSPLDAPVRLEAVSFAYPSRPKLVLFDEPSLGLAPNIVERTFDIITAIRAEGVTVMMVEQNALAALELSDRAYVLEQGRITRTGSGKELLGDPEVKKAYLGG